MMGKYENSLFTSLGVRVIWCSLTTLPAIVNFLSRPFVNLEVFAINYPLLMDWVLYTPLAWQWWMAEAPLIFSGLSMMKLPFQTMERSTARSPIFPPSYMYWKAETETKESVLNIGTGREELTCGVEWIKGYRKWQSGENERMKGQRWDNAFNHLSFSAMVVCSSPLWHVGTQTQARVTNQAHLRKMAFLYIITVAAVQLHLNASIYQPVTWPHLDAVEMTCWSSSWESGRDRKRI